MNVADADALAGKWIMEAQKHEMAARQIEDWSDEGGGNEESLIHREIATVLYQCAQDLQHPAAETSEAEDEVRF